AQAEVLAAAPENDEERIRLLHETHLLDGHVREDLDLLAKRAADVFKVGFAVISAIDRDKEFIVGQSKDLPGVRTKDGTDMIVMRRDDAVCNHVVSTGEVLVVEDTQRDPMFADHPAVELWNTRFYAGAPLRLPDGHVLGALCLLDNEPHELTEKETQLLETLAADVVAVITGEEADEVKLEDEKEPASATVGQIVPDSAARNISPPPALRIIIEGEAFHGAGLLRTGTRTAAAVGCLERGRHRHCCLRRSPRSLPPPFRSFASAAARPGASSFPCLRSEEHTSELQS